MTFASSGRPATQAWETASAGVPQMAEAIKSRLDMLQKSRKPPAGLDSATIETAKAGLVDLNQSWTAASEALKSGNLTDAAGKARVAKTKAVEIMTALNRQVPAAAK